ncbi:hypothetical protein R1sor_010227 [Riccia sorocarpa]|uniref:Fungal lipase-type domain-containing protein n=1 Tax=Riccia sorocarpa TaxID=122646 RepID=A0ABD3HYV4_9MARC
MPPSIRLLEPDQLPFNTKEGTEQMFHSRAVSASERSLTGCSSDANHLRLQSQPKISSHLVHPIRLRYVTFQEEGAISGPMAKALLLPVPTAATASPTVLREISTSHSSCKFGSSTVFGSSLRRTNNFSGLEEAGDSSYKLRIRSGRSSSRGDEILPKSSASSSVSLQETEAFDSSTYIEDQGRDPKHPYAHLKVGERWPEFQGKNNWAGLLDPLDPVLRGEIIRYGEFCQVAYDGFDYDSHSRYCGSCRWNKQKLLAKTGLANRGYEVTDYLYSTSGLGVTKVFKKFKKDDDDDDNNNKSWDQESNWMGYIAVSTDPKEIARLGRRDIVIVWRGTVTGLEWAENCRDYLAPGAFDYENGLGTDEIKFEAGFVDLYVSKSKSENSRFTKKSAREQVHAAVRRLCRKYKNEQLSFSITGHSLGSAMAKLTAYDLAENAYQWRQKNLQVKDFNKIPITVFSFAGPRVGNDAFRDRMDELGVKVLRIVNKHDSIPKVPGILLNEGLDFVETNAEWLYHWIERLPWTYTHCGVELQIDHMVSPYLKKMPVYKLANAKSNAHNLEAYLHVLNGFTGKKEFNPLFDRDLALVNKDGDILRSKHSIPPAWRQEENKGLMRTKVGRWIPRDRDPEDIPQYEDLNDEPHLEFVPTNASSW